MHHLAAPFALLFATVAFAQTPPHGLRVPPGFVVHEFAGNDLANDIHCMTLSDTGRVLVSGRGYLRWLDDTKGTGVADRVIEVGHAPAGGAMGMLVEGDTLYVCGTGGLFRYPLDREGKAVATPEKLYKLNASGEHDAHALKRGPDGWLYWLVGNTAGLSAKDANVSTSPIREPIAGGVLRFSPDFTQREIVCDGLRNPYGFDFSADGELFLYDSDNERDLGLPWYEFTRFYHVVAGQGYGWQNPQRTQTWRLPPHFPDVAKPVALLGRGSPTGVAAYRHTHFPSAYTNAIFLADWTFGRIDAVRLKLDGSGFTGEVERFAETVGSGGFAPVALAVHPKTGELWTAIGGRGTRGAVYRIGFAERTNQGTSIPVAPRSLAWVEADRPRLVREAVGDDRQLRRRALEQLVRYAERVTSDEVATLAESGEASADRIVRDLTKQLLTRSPAVAADGLLAGRARPDAARAAVLTTLARTNAPAWRVLEAVRLAQITADGLAAKDVQGTVWEGYAPRGVVDAALLPALRAHLADTDPDVRRELLRTLAMAQDSDPATASACLAGITTATDPRDDIHHLCCLSRLKSTADAEQTQRVASVLLALDGKMRTANLARDRHWPIRVSELHAHLSRRDPGLNAALLANAAFGQPADSLWTRAPGFDRAAAARKILAGRANEGFPWTAELATLLKELPDGPAIARRLWGQAGVDDSLLPLLAAKPQADDRPRFAAALRWPQPAQVTKALAALESLPPAPSPDPAELLACVRLLRELPAKDATRDRAAVHLAKLTGQAHAADAVAWSAWFAKAYPQQAVALAGPDGVDVAAWDRRFAGIDWATGNADAGAKVFAKASCSSCHGGAQALGPDLAGVSKRFGRSDLLAAITQPSKDISPRYRTVQILTSDGQQYTGLIVYEAVDGVLLQTGPAATVRIPGDRIDSRQPSDRSLMPAGLLDVLADREIADLIAYLQSR